MIYPFLVVIMLALAFDFTSHVVKTERALGIKNELSSVLMLFFFGCLLSPVAAARLIYSLFTKKKQSSL